MAIGDIKTFEIVYTGLTLKINAIDLGGGQTTFEVICVSGSADINALYWNDGDTTVDGGSLLGFNAKKDASLNMNGTGEVWDGGVKLSSAGIGTEGLNKATYLQTGETYVQTAAVDWNTIDTLGVRATSTSTAEGSIKGVDGDGVVTLAPKACVVDAVPVIEGANASFEIHLDHVYAYDVTISYETHTGTAGASDYTTTSGSVTIEAGDLSTTVAVATTDDQDVEQTETFTLHLTGATADIPGTDISVAILCADGTGTILDNDIEPPPGGNNPPPDPTALSHGYWMNNPFSDSEGFAGGVGAQTFDDFFTLDTPTDHAWEDQTGAGPQKVIAELEDLTFERAVAFGNGAGSGGDIMDPDVSGDYQNLVREAATAVLNYHDADNSASFVAWYIYERNLTDNDDDATNNPTNAAEVLVDLQAQVDATLSGDAGAYSADDLANLLQATHH
jgi:Calx-beta domain